MVTFNPPTHNCFSNLLSLPQKYRNPSHKQEKRNTKSSSGCRLPTYSSCCSSSSSFSSTSSCLLLPILLPSCPLPALFHPLNLLLFFSPSPPPPSSSSSYPSFLISFFFFHSSSSTTSFLLHLHPPPFFFCFLFFLSSSRMLFQFIVVIDVVEVRFFFANIVYPQRSPLDQKGLASKLHFCCDHAVFLFRISMSRAISFSYLTPSNRWDYVVVYIRLMIKLR